MLKRFLSLFLSIVMVLSAVPFQVFAEENIEEATEAVQTEETLAEEETLPEETVTEETEPEVTESEVTEPEVTEPEVTEPEVTEPEETEPEATKPEKKQEHRLPPATHIEIRPETLTKTEDVRVVEVDENGCLHYYDTTETTSTSFLVAEEVRNYPANTRTIDQWDNGYAFETFEELKQLCAGSYSGYTYFVYFGEGPLVISEDLTIPQHAELNCWENPVIVNEGVTLSTGNWSDGIYTDTMIINGTFISRTYAHVESNLEINGSLVLYSNMGLGSNATISGFENIQFMYEYTYLEKNFYAETFEEFKAALATAKKDNSGITYFISWSNWEEPDLVLSESVTVPAHVRVYLGDYEGTFTIAKGVTLELNSTDYSSFGGDVTVEGKLVNNCSNLNVGGTLTFSQNGSYSGNGMLFHYTENPNETLEDWLSGLDMTSIEVVENRYPEDDWYSWELRNVAGMTKLGTPKNLMWNKDYTWEYNEKKDTWEQKLEDRNGCVAWVPVEPDQGQAKIVYYKDGEVFYSTQWYFGSMELPAYRSIDEFILKDPESGTYYFTVQSMADGNKYRNSDIATSGTWTYTKPKKSLETCTNLSWDWPTANWTTPDGSALSCEVEFFYSPTANGELQSVGITWGPTAEWGAQPWDEMIQQFGTGYYYFRVRPLSDDITKICNGTWSELSPAYNLDKTVENVKTQLDSISTKADDEVIRDTVQSLDTEELKSAMLADKGSEGIMDQLEKLENAVGGAAPVEVSSEVALDADKITIVGANLNDAAENSSDPITLVVDKPEKEHILDAAYDNSVAVSFSMTLDNAADAENLEVPVKITLPVPADINPDFLVILHYKKNGEIEELALGDVHVYRQGNQYYASFVLTSFSDFVMTNYADNVIASGVTGDVEWKVTGWGNLIISGEGSTGHYQVGGIEFAPWHTYADQINTVVVEEGVTSLGTAVFYDLPYVTTVSLPETLEYILEFALSRCVSLESITIPASVMFVHGNSFTECSALKEILVEEGSRYSSEDGVLTISYDYGDGVEHSYLVAYPNGKQDAVYEVPEHVNWIDTWAFAEAKMLQEAILPSNLEGIGTEAFSRSGIETVTIPSSVTMISYYAFAECTDLQTIYFQGDPMPICENAFLSVDADAYYPADNENWTEDFMQSYGGNLSWYPSDYIEVTGAAEVEGGKSVKLTAQILPENTAGNKIKWALAEGDEEYASIKASGNSVTVTAADVSELHVVTVIASSAEGIAPCKYELTILPKVKAMDLYFWYEDIENDEAYWYYLDPEYQWAWVLEEGDEDGYFMAEMYAEVLPYGANAEVTWTSSNTSVATIETVYEDGVYYGIAYGTGKTGSVTFTATTKNGVKASYTWKVIDLDIDAEPVGDTELRLMGGQSTTLKVRDAETKKALSSKNVIWTLWAEDGSDASAYATINSSGKLTTKKVTEAVTIYAGAEVHKDYFLSDYVEYKITLYPAATHVELEYNGMPANGQTVNYDVNSPEPSMIMAQLLPDDAMPEDVKWEISDKKGTYAEYTFGEVPNTLLISNPTGKAGTVTIKATAQDGSKKTATMKVQFGTFADEVTILNTETELVSGKSLTLKAQVTPDKVTKSGVTWSLKNPEDKAYVTLSGSKLTAKAVYEKKTVTLIAASKDGMASASYDITIVPKDPGMLVIYDSYTGENVTKDTIYVDLSEKERDLSLVAKNYADGSDVDVTWSVKGNSADYSGWGDQLWLFMQKAGSVTVTAKDKNNSKRTATVTIKAAYLAWYVDITTKDGKNIIEDANGQKIIEVASGKSVDLKAAVKDRNARAASSSKVTWSIVEGGEYAKITSAGKLTANKDVTSAQTVWVCAAAADGSGAKAEIPVVVKPLATGIKIYTLEQDMEMRTLNAYSNSWMNNRSNTNLIWDMAAVDENGSVNDSFQIYSMVYPYYEGNADRSAMQDVTWKSSAPKVASIDADGKVTCLTAGTTTITATAADGSGQKISFKLTVVKRMHSVQLADAEVAGGKSITMKPIIEPLDTTNKKLYWGIYGDTAFASISQSGNLTTKKVTEPKTVWVYVWSQDGSDVYGECKVTIYPKAVSKVSILNAGEDVTGKTLTLKVGESITLTNENSPYNASQACTWKSSAGDAASVENGVVTAVKAGKTVTITCTAADGSNQKSTVKIKIVK